VCVCVRASVRACVRACVCACVWLLSVEQAKQYVMQFLCSVLVSL